MIYSEDYFFYRNLDQHDNKTREIIRSFKKQSYKQYIHRYFTCVPDGGKILDIGCGEGYFLQTVQEYGYKPYGVEISEIASSIARENVKGTIITGILHDAQFESNFFDVVTLFDVVEHFHNPVEEMQEIYRITKPGGMCFILTPDAGGIIPFIMRSNWFELKPPEHLFYFTKKTLGRLLQTTGFLDIQTFSSGKILTLEYIAAILKHSNPIIARMVKAGLGWTPFYRRTLSFNFGYAAGIGRKL